MKFFKYHGLGNDYIVMNPSDIKDELTVSRIKLICHRNYGVGSDGILLGPLESAECDFGLRIFNPDGSEAEMCGNGIRCVARFLLGLGRCRDEEVFVDTASGLKKLRIILLKTCADSTV